MRLRSVHTVHSGHLILRGPLAYNTEETCRLLSTMILDAIGNIGNGSDSQIIGRLENLGCCTWGSHPDLFSLDLVSLILRLSSPKLRVQTLHVGRQPGQQANEKKKPAYKRDSWAGAGLWMTAARAWHGTASLRDLPAVAPQPQGRLRPLLRRAQR